MMVTTQLGDCEAKKLWSSRRLVLDWQWPCSTVLSQVQPESGRVLQQRNSQDSLCHVCRSLRHLCAYTVAKVLADLKACRQLAQTMKAVAATLYSERVDPSLVLYEIRGRRSHERVTASVTQQWLEQRKTPLPA